MFGWTLLARAVNVWNHTTPCAKLRESVREAKDQITEQVNKHVRARRHLTGLSKIDPSSDSKVV